MQTEVPFVIPHCLQTNKMVGPDTFTVHKHAVPSYSVLELVTVTELN
jgi:hypothetical protein